MTRGRARTAHAPVAGGVRAGVPITGWEGTSTATSHAESPASPSVPAGTTSPGSGPARRSGPLPILYFPSSWAGIIQFPPACFDLELPSQILCLRLVLAVPSPLHSCPQLSVTLSAIRTGTSGWLAITSHLSPRPTLSMSAGATAEAQTSDPAWPLPLAVDTLHFLHPGTLTSLPCSKVPTGPTLGPLDPPSCLSYVCPVCAPPGIGHPWPTSPASGSCLTAGASQLCCLSHLPLSRSNVTPLPHL